MITINDIRTYQEQLDTSDEIGDLLDVLWDNIDTVTQQAIEKDFKLQAAVDTAIETVKGKRKQHIRDMADKLPDGDPLKEAINNVSVGGN